jgi:mannose-6-phosphate isomerase-like protein (cupin superfamily)
MYKLIRSDELQPSPRGTVRFVDEPHGSGVSFFLVNYESADGPGLHKHPYPETWIVRSGTGRFTAGDEEIEAGAGDVVVVGAEVPHKFKNAGEGRLEATCIHPSPQMIQEDLEE